MNLHSRSEEDESNHEKDLDKTQNKVKRHFIKNYLVEYTENSNLHGLKYIGEKERTPVEKYFWVIVFTCSAVLCAVLIRNLYIKWVNSPVIVTFAENTTPVWEIPYPAVTVCFETKSLQSKFNFTRYYRLYTNVSAYENLTELERCIYEDATLVCSNRHIMAPLKGRNCSDGKSIIQSIDLVAPKIFDFFGLCKWRGKEEKCEKLFSPILTEDGLCYSFNIIGAQELFKMENMHQEYPYLVNNKSAHSWSNENGYTPFGPLDTYPHRSMGYGMESGLEITFHVSKKDLDYVCKGPVQGYKVLLHHPAQLPRSNQHFYRIPMSREVILAVTPQVMTTSDGLQSYNSFQRKCYFRDDRYLRYFKEYSQNNCEIECLTNFTYAVCGCVHFAMPHAPDMQVCNASNFICLRDARTHLVKAAIQSHENVAQNDTRENLGATVAAQCKCLPACSSIDYKAEVSQAYLDIEAIYQAFGYDFENMHDYKFSQVKIFFEAAQFIASRRSELYGRIDFLANCGGVLGLCMGFSILSVAEIIYFLTLRVIIWRKRSSKKIMNIGE